MFISDGTWFDILFMTCLTRSQNSRSDRSTEWRISSDEFPGRSYTFFFSKSCLWGTVMVMASACRLWYNSILYCPQAIRTKPTCGDLVSCWSRKERYHSWQHNIPAVRAAVGSLQSQSPYMCTDDSQSTFQNSVWVRSAALIYFTVTTAVFRITRLRNGLQEGLM